MTARDPAPRATFQEQVLDRLGRDICAGRYRPGELLPSEAELCERFAFSRIVIREAIKSLAAKGMLEVRRRVGTLVLEPARWNLFDSSVMAWRVGSGQVDPAMSRDLGELRRIVEPAAVRLAALRASDDERRALRAAYMTMARAVAGKGDYVTADLAFHAALLAACGNQYLRQMQQAMSAVLQASFKLTAGKPGGPALTLPMHEAVCLAIEQRDPVAAERAALALIEQAEADLEDRLSARLPAPAAVGRPASGRKPLRTA